MVIRPVDCCLRGHSSPVLVTVRYIKYCRDSIKTVTVATSQGVTVASNAVPTVVSEAELALLRSQLRKEFV